MKISTVNVLSWPARVTLINSVQCYGPSPCQTWMNDPQNLCHLLLRSHWSLMMPAFQPILLLILADIRKRIVSFSLHWNLEAILIIFSLMLSVLDVFSVWRPQDWNSVGFFTGLLQVTIKAILKMHFFMNFICCYYTIPNGEGSFSAIAHPP